MNLRFLDRLEARVRKGKLDNLAQRDGARLRAALPALGFSKREIRAALSGRIDAAGAAILEAHRRVREGSLVLGKALIAIEDRRSRKQFREAVRDLESLAANSPVEMYRSMALRAVERDGTR